MDCQEMKQVPLAGCLLIGQGSLGGQSLSAPAGYDGSPSRSPAPLTRYSCGDVCPSLPLDLGLLLSC